MDIGEMEDGQKMERESDINLVDAKIGEQEPPPSAEDKDPGENVQSPPPPPSAKDENPGENLKSAPSQAASDVKSDESPITDHPTDVKTIAEVETNVDASGVNDNAPRANELEAVTPQPLAKSAIAKDEDGSEGELKNEFNDKAVADASELGTGEEVADFAKEVESFYREHSLDFKHPKFYGEPLDLLKLWKAVTRLGGYDQVTASKLWRQVGDSFHPPKTCTTVSWTFRIFYEKALLEYERHKRNRGELQPSSVPISETKTEEKEGSGYQASGTGRARRDAAARAMQGWHVQRLFGYGEVGEPIIKDKSFNSAQKRERPLKSIDSGLHKHKKPTLMEDVEKAEAAKQLDATVADVGAPADWVKINVRETKDCFEVYALVPGLLREEVRVQSDPAGRLVITGQPEQVDNPWGIKPFKKVVSLPARIDPLQTSAVVSLHGRLYVRVPFEKGSG
ncbi:AT-rich interactive domain-containing protein 6 [Vitis riparia]|uniref:AT-rich interactive domain-containing protein 6 n=1 Tax=Vitis riparia TaxID=96939 RepID=UPI00155A0C8D|nr:AT-rich interactive domain-containing protein 6 [Vitis riparia]XP_034676009.1 AT-rich interactive domain-containing protein 6 [Vitis riparia]